MISTVCSCCNQHALAFSSPRRTSKEFFLWWVIWHFEELLVWLKPSKSIRTIQGTVYEFDGVHVEVCSWRWIRRFAMFWRSVWSGPSNLKLVCSWRSHNKYDTKILPEWYQRQHGYLHQQREVAYRRHEQESSPLSCRLCCWSVFDNKVLNLAELSSRWRFKYVSWWPLAGRRHRRCYGQFVPLWGPACFPSI